MATVAELWGRWEAWLARHAPDLAANLGGPASDIAIAAAEAALGARMPPALRQLYAAVNGAPLIVGGHDIADLEGLVAARERLIRQRSDEARGWFPFVDQHTGDYAALDRRGRVVEIAGDGDDVAVLGDSLEAWMEAIVGDLERGLYRWSAVHQVFEPASVATGFRWLSTDDGRDHAFVLEPGAPVHEVDSDGSGFELVSIASLDEPGAGAVLYIESDGERVWQRPIAELEGGGEGGPDELEVGRSVDGHRRLAVGIDRCDQRYYLFHQRYDPELRRLERGLAHLKRALSAAEIDAAIAEINALVSLPFSREPAASAVLYRTCSRHALELARGGAVFDATRVVRALAPHVAAVGGEAEHRWRFARVAVDVAIAANDPELVSEIDRVLIPALDLAAVVDPETSPDGVAALYNLACLHARFGDRDGCLRYAELALERGSPTSEMRDDPDFDPLAGDPELMALLERFDRDR